MKSISEINNLLQSFESKFGYPLKGADQGSEAWFKAKLGIVSASRASEAVSKKGTATRLTYLCDLAAQIATGCMEEINSKYTDWGIQHEDAARSYYEFSTGLKMTRLPFVFKDDNYREGCSPDGFVTDKKGAEIKCPWDSGNYIKFLVESAAKPEWKWQNQFTMRVTGADEWDFVQFDPRMKKRPMKIMTIERDLDMQKQLDENIPELILDLDKMLSEIGIKFGDQWLRLNKIQPETHPK